MAWNQIAKVFNFESAFEARGKEATKWGNKGSENAWNFEVQYSYIEDLPSMTIWNWNGRIPTVAP